MADSLDAGNSRFHAANAGRTDRDDHPAHQQRDAGQRLGECVTELVDRRDDSPWLLTPRRDVGDQAVLSLGHVPRRQGRNRWQILELRGGLELVVRDLRDVEGIAFWSRERPTGATI